MYKTPKDIRMITKFMDDSLTLPVVNVRIGADVLIGLVPIAGDLVTTLVSVYLLFRYWKVGASGKLLTLMTLNILFDLITGFVPVIGDLVDIGFKANLRNLNLWEDFATEAKYTGSGKGVLIGLMLFILAVVSLVIVGIVALINWMIRTVI